MTVAEQWRAPAGVVLWVRGPSGPLPPKAAGNSRRPKAGSARNLSRLRRDKVASPETGRPCTAAGGATVVPVAGGVAMRKSPLTIVFVIALATGLPALAADHPLDPLSDEEVWRDPRPPARRRAHGQGHEVLPVDPGRAGQAGRPGLAAGRADAAPGVRPGAPGGRHVRGRRGSDRGGGRLLGAARWRGTQLARRRVRRAGRQGAGTPGLPRRARSPGRNGPDLRRLRRGAARLLRHGGGTGPPHRPRELQRAGRRGAARDRGPDRGRGPGSRGGPPGHRRGRGPHSRRPDRLPRHAGRGTAGSRADGDSPAARPRLRARRLPGRLAEPGASTSGPTSARASSSRS